jgi:hypothetical protein
MQVGPFQVILALQVGVIPVVSGYKGGIAMRRLWWYSLRTANMASCSYRTA